MASRTFISRRLASLPSQTPLLFLRATITTTSCHQKSAVDSAKDTLKKVDHAISEKLVDGIDIGSTFLHCSLLSPYLGTYPKTKPISPA